MPARRSRGAEPSGHRARERGVPSTRGCEARELAEPDTLSRHVLVDAARARGADKRGGHAVRVSLSEASERPPDLGEDVIALNDALDALERVDVRKARIVELRFFAGLSVEETAVALGVSSQTVGREWTFVKAWLRRELKHG